MIPTLADLFLPLAFDFQLVEGIRHGQNLHSTYSGEHVSVMAGRRTKSTVLMLAREHEVNDFLSWEGIGTTQQMECSQAPVQPAQPEVLRQPVVQLILPHIQALDILDVSFSGKLQVSGCFFGLCHIVVRLRAR